MYTLFPAFNIIRREKMNTIQTISEGLKDFPIAEPLGEGITRGEQLEIVSTNVCNNIALMGQLTDNNADLEFILSVVGSYLITKSKGALPIDSKPPSYIFDTNLFPILDNSEEVIVEEIPDGE